MTYRLAYTDRAIKNLKKLPADHAKVIYDWIGGNLVASQNPRTVPTYKPLAGTANGARYRVGKYRILATIKDDILTIEVVRVAHRKEAYRNLPKDI